MRIKTKKPALAYQNRLVIDRDRKFLISYIGESYNLILLPNNRPWTGPIVSLT